MNQLIILHGTLSKPERSWFPWLAWQMLEKQWDVIIPRLPTPENQSPASWRQAFYKQVAGINQQTVIVGHSTGVPFALRLLEELALPSQIRGLFLVAGFSRSIDNPEYDTIINPYIEEPFQWQKIKSVAPIVRVYHGDNDDIVPLSCGEQLAQELGVPLTVIANGQHLNTAAGFTTFPLLRDDILRTIV